MKQITIPEIAGIYAVHILDDDTWYIGESGDVYNRLQTHASVTFSGKNIEFFLLEETGNKSKANRHVLETKWHKKLSYYNLISTPAIGHPSRGRRKLSKEDIVYIRTHFKAWDKTWGAKPLAQKFNVSRQTIGDIVHKRAG